MEEKQPENGEKKVIRYRLVRHKWPDEIQAEKERRMKRFLIVCACITCFSVGFITNTLLGNQIITDEKYSKFDQIYDVMLNNWYFGKDVEDLSDTLMKNAINGLVDNSLDPHTSYMDVEQANSFITSLQGNFIGIGVQVSAMDDETVLIERVYKGSGAEKAGLISGDIITKVDGTSVVGETLSEVTNRIKGEEGTTVQLSILRENKEIEIQVVRGTVNDSVFGYTQGTIGFMEIDSFAETTGADAGAYFADFKTQGVRNLIIDLRDNGGGYVEAAKKIASYLLPEGSLVYQEQRKNGDITQAKIYHDYETYTFDKIVILINDGTASASEVLTCALQEQLDNVVTVGTKSYGKGTMQQPITFADGSSLKYTIAEWLTPLGNHIHGVGITPDYEVALDPALTTAIPSISDDIAYGADSVSAYAKFVQLQLKFLGYHVDRVDQYFSYTSSTALKQYQQSVGLVADGIIRTDTIKSLLSSCEKKWHDEKENLDVQKKQALELVS